SSTAAAGSVKLAKDTDFRVSITNAPGKDAYPISSYTWLLVKVDNKDGAKAKLIRDFLSWMITDEAQNMARELQYAPLPAEVRGLMAARIRALRADGKPIAMNGPAPGSGRPIAGPGAFPRSRAVFRPAVTHPLQLRDGPSR